MSLESAPLPGDSAENAELALRKAMQISLAEKYASDRGQDFSEEFLMKWINEYGNSFDKIFNPSLMETWNDDESEEKTSAIEKIKDDLEEEKKKSYH